MGFEQEILRGQIVKIGHQFKGCARRRYEVVFKNYEQWMMSTKNERTIGTSSYLEICSNYIDIFLLERLDLRSRVVLASKVSFFFRLWKLWLKHGNHGVLGNSKSLSA